MVYASNFVNKKNRLYMGRQVVIELLREAPFLKGGTVFRGADMDDPNIGNIQLKTEPYLGKVLGARTERICFNGAENRWAWDTDFLSEDDFKKEVAKCAIVGENRRIISYDDINFYDRDSDFFTDDKFSVILTGGKAVLDTANPYHNIMSAFFFNDSRFVRVSGEEMPNYGEEIYSIGLADAVERARIENSEITMDVATVLQKMTRESLLILCKLWNLAPSNKTSDKAIRANLFDHISKDADMTNTKSRGRLTLRFADLGPEKLKVFNTFLDGLKTRLITRDADDSIYVFSGKELGKDAEDSVEFLYLSSSASLLKDLQTGVKLKTNKKTKDDAVLLVDSEDKGDKGGSQSENT